MDVLFFADIIFMLFYKSITWDEMKHIHRSRPILIIILELISVVPIDLFYYYTSTDPSFKVTMILRLRYPIRMIRVILELNNMKNTVGHSLLPLIFIELLLAVTLSMLFCTCVIYLLYCSESTCTYSPHVFMEQLNMIAQKIGGRGFYRDTQARDAVYYTFIFVNFGIYIYFKAFAVGKATCALKQRNLSRAMYANRVAAVQHTFADLFNKDRSLKKTCIDYYNVFWKKRRGMLIMDNMKNVIPDVSNSDALFLK